MASNGKKKPEPAKSEDVASRLKHFFRLKNAERKAKDGD